MRHIFYSQGNKTATKTTLSHGATLAELLPISSGAARYQPADIFVLPENLSGHGFRGNPFPTCELPICDRKASDILRWTCPHHYKKSLDWTYRYLKFTLLEVPCIYLLAYCSFLVFTLYLNVFDGCFSLPWVYVTIKHETRIGITLLIS